jgi:3-hydroxypropanoate dehydrogenase
MGEKMGLKVLSNLFINARTHSAWLDKDVDEKILNDLYDLAKMPPTAANCQPMRLVFVKSKEQKQKLAQFLDDGNIEKTLKAPVTAIIAYDTKFYEHLDFLFPHVNAKSWFEGNDELIKSTCVLNSSLQGAYLILAARSLGLDCGPMGGFNNEKLDKKFFSDGRYKSLFLCNLGYGDDSFLHKRSPRFGFDEACKIL